MGVSKNSGTPKSSILIGFSIVNHPFWGPTPIFGNTHMDLVDKENSTTELVLQNSDERTAYLRGSFQWMDTW